MNENKSKFRWTYLVVLLLIVLVFVLIFTNNGYSGERITGGKEEVQELVDGRTNADKDNKWEKVVAVYYTTDTMYFLLEDSNYTNRFPDYADYYINYITEDELTELRNIINEYNNNELNTEKIAVEVAVQGVNAWDIIYPILYIAFGLFLVWMTYIKNNWCNHSDGERAGKAVSPSGFTAFWKYR